MPAVAIETVIIIIVVVSFAVLAAVVFALYWLWHLLLEDRRCSRLNRHSFHPEFYRHSSFGPTEDASNRNLLSSSRDRRNPRISRRREVFVDERSRRLGKVLRNIEPEPLILAVNTNTRSSGTSTNSSSIIVPRPLMPLTRIEEVRPPDVVVLDGTEPPPPYEEIVR